MLSALGAESQEGIREVPYHRTQARHQLARLIEHCVDLANASVRRCRVRERLEHVDSAPSNPVQSALELRESPPHLPPNRGYPPAGGGRDRPPQSPPPAPQDGSTRPDPLQTQ